MPRMNGWDVCEQIRRVSDVPILMLTSLDDSKDIVKGFQLGADDFLSKPFAVDVLQARIEAILRRAERFARPGPGLVVQAGPLKLDTNQRQTWLGKREVFLTPLEFDLLLYLASRPGENISKERLFKDVWGYHSSSDSNLVEVGMRRLREKVEDDPSTPRMLLTVRGVGYRFVSLPTPEDE
jgi:two-component system response regulator MtrA